MFFRFTTEEVSLEFADFATEKFQLPVHFLQALIGPSMSQGQRNEPSFVIETARQIGQLRALPAEEIGQRTADNFSKFFKLSERVKK